MRGGCQIFPKCIKFECSIVAIREGVKFNCAIISEVYIFLSLVLDKVRVIFNGGYPFFDPLFLYVGGWLRGWVRNFLTSFYP